jgi:hypothetical protein
MRFEQKLSELSGLDNTEGHLTQNIGAAPSTASTPLVLRPRASTKVCSRWTVFSNALNSADIPPNCAYWDRTALAGSIGAAGHDENIGCDDNIRANLEVLCTTKNWLKLRVNTLYRALDSISLLSTDTPSYVESSNMMTTSELRSIVLEIFCQSFDTIS